MGVSLVSCLVFSRAWQVSVLDKTKFLSYRQFHKKRIWPEVNQRINYPLKHLLIQMEVNQIIDMRDETVKFCFSWVTILMCDLIVRACAHPTGLAGFTIRSMMCLRYENFLRISILQSLGCFVNEIWKIENSH